ncbi:MAG: hypothetical protein KKC37_07430 [Proteobacteria bacterium]|nr:hypothetical protein [Pseudomonadota bacterium]
MSIRLLPLALMVGIVAGGVASAAVDDQAAVKQTILNYLQATAEGDFEARERLSTGLASHYNARPGTARFQFHQAFARTFLGLGRGDPAPRGRPQDHDRHHQHRRQSRP